MGCSAMHLIASHAAPRTEVNFMRDPEFHDLLKILDSCYRKLHQKVLTVPCI